MSEPLRTIIVEDSEDDMLLLLRQLRKGGYEPDYICVDTAESMSAALTKGKWDLILSDYNLPHFSGAEALDVCKSHHLDIPFIVVSGAVGEEAAVSLMKAGAHDFIRKDNLIRLLPAIERELKEADIREMRRCAERALRDSEEKFRNLVDSSPDAILALDESGVVLSTNAAAGRVWGIRAEDVVGKSFFELSILRPASGPVAEKEFQRTLAGVVRPPYNLTTQHISGSEVFVEVNSLLMKQTHSGARVQMTLRNVTDRQKLENQLQLSQKMEAIGQLAGGVAHDFNNQLSGIIGCAEILQSEMIDNPELKWFVDTIASAAERAASLTRQLLAFARKSKYQTSPVHIHQVIAEVVPLLQHTLDRRITIEQRLNANPDLVMGDPSQLQNAILNLAVNARDAMVDGGTLSLTSEITELNDEFCHHHPHQVAPGLYLKISVTDTGCGIETEAMPHIFEPFFTTKPIGQGTGLGLSAVYGAVKSHNGTISVQSEEGKGTTVNLFLPLGTQDAAPANGYAEAEAVRGSGHILIIDDEVIVRSIVERMLTRLGYEVVVCEDGQRGLKYFRKHKDQIDLIILDMVMPKLSGRETFHKLHEIKKSIPILVASGHAMSTDIQEMLDHGAIDFVQKPFRIKPLSKAVAKAIRGG